MDDSGILGAIERAETRVRRETDRRIREAQAWGDDELTRYGQVRSALKTESDRVPEKSSKSTSPRRRRGPEGRVNRKRMSPASPKELADRRDKVGRFIEESTEPIALGAIGRALGLSSHRVTIAIQGLIEEKRIKTVGSGSATRYVAYDSGSGRLIRQAPTQGTPEERIVALLEDRHQATADELAQALREPVQKVVEMCGRLQAEERVRMSNLNGRQVYILAVRV